ncbi:hypothetical protein [Enterovirga sp.]|uniref:hypothetical protein n=1 Tax=Enterovirga sp. TaxID=2026350 RepID=UPI002C970C79|nr:hypothetical protein [Enterovirga sp.]HMO29507.1 hypothetical protein [Enterovirga sp.]
MSQNLYHPHVLEVAESSRKPGLFEWSIRTHGKLAERGDRPFNTAAAAQGNGEKAIERLLLPKDNRR